MDTEPETEIRWISKARARRRLGIGPAALDALVCSGSLTVRKIPGSFCKLRLDEVDALLDRSTKPAREPLSIEA